MPKMSLKSVVTVVAFLLGGSIANGDTASKPAESPIATRIFYGECMRLTEEEKTRAAIAPIAAAVLPSLISNTLDRFGKALRGMGEADGFALTAQHNLEVEYGIVEPCVQWVRGRFAEQSAETTGGHLRALSGEEEESLAVLGIYLAESPDLFVETRLRVSADASAVALAPTYVEYNRTLKKRSDNSDKVRGLAIQFSFHAPGQAPDGANAVGGSLVLGNLRVGEVRRYTMPYSANDGFDYESPWFPTFAPPKTSSEIHIMSGNSSLGRSMPAVDTKPMTLTATLAEMRDANEFLLFLADVFGGSKQDLKQALEAQLVKEKRQEAELSAFKDSQANVAAYYTKFADAEAKLVEYCNATRQQTREAQKERLTRSRDAYVAQVEANVAATGASLPMPYQEFIIISDKVAPCEGASG